MSLLTKKQAMEMLGVSIATINRILTEIPYVKIRGSVRIKEDDLKKYIEGNIKEPPPPVIKATKGFSYTPGQKLV